MHIKKFISKPMKKIFILLSFVLTINVCIAQKTYTLNGYITDSKSGEALIGATVYSPTYKRGTATNAYGFYSVSLPTDTGTVIFSFIGYQPQMVKYKKTDTEKQLNIKLLEESSELTEVVIVGTSQAKEAINTTEGSVVSIKMKDIELLPSVLGESDIIKALQLMPGVTPGGELSTSMFVRGGEGDQNLVILDEAVVYNSGHLIGFFSVFNSDIIKDVKLYKGGFPASYGGRISSVMDVRMKEGNLNEYHANASVGVLSSKLAVEGPILKDKLSFILAGRRTYIDQVSKIFNFPIPFYFYDVNAKINWKITNNDRIFISTYLGNDVLYSPEFETDSLETDSLQTDSTGTMEPPSFGFTMGNKTLTVRWNHLFSSKLFSNTSLIYNNFRYDVEATDGFNNLLIRSSLEDYSAKTDFDYNLNSNNQISFGAMFTQHKFKPNLVYTTGEISEYIEGQNNLNLQTIEAAAYLLDDFTILKKLKINIGLRYGYVINDDITYEGLEPRLFVNWVINEKNSFKTGYSKMYQYLHRVSSSNFILPTDMYYPVTKLIKPQSSDLYFFSYSHNYEKQNVVLTMEAYQKQMYNLIEFREGTKLFLNNNFEEDLLSGNGYSYGFEILLQKTEGDVTGWIGYTFSRTARIFEEINFGEEYLAKNDRLHNFSAVAIFKISEKIDLSTNWIYLSGARFTPIIGQYLMPNAAQTGLEVIPVFAARNSVKMSEIHRLDASIIYKPGKNKNKRFESEWQIGMYNIYNRSAPYTIQIVYDERGYYQYQEPGLFGRVFSLSYSIKF